MPVKWLRKTRSNPAIKHWQYKPVTRRRRLHGRGVMKQPSDSCPFCGVSKCEFFACFHARKGVSDKDGVSGGVTISTCTSRKPAWFMALRWRDTLLPMQTNNTLIGVDAAMPL